MKPEVGQIWKHSKKGNLYKVIALGKHSETLEDMVVYEHEGNELSLIWIRPLSMWTEEVEIDNKKLPRFTLVS